MNRANFFFALVTTISPQVEAANGSTDASDRGDNPFVLIARLHALPNAAQEVLRLSKAADIAVKATEPGLLVHAFDQDPTAPLKFVWTEVYADSNALIFHLENPLLQDYLCRVSPLLDSFTVELCGHVSEEAADMLRSTGTPAQHFQNKFGYVRNLVP